MNTTPKDFFLHLSATVLLYIGAIALINLAFSIINYAFPDALAGYFYSNSVATPISILVILTPLLYVIEWLINRDIARHSAKKELWVRRWRIYLTLFLAGAVIVGDLITLINTYLNGEITSRLVYKVIAVLLITGVIFTYYLLDRIDGKAHALWKTVLAWAGIILVVAGIVGGFIIVGSPGKQRALRFDQQRIYDLQNIQGQVIGYWTTKGMIPDTLAQLNDPLSGSQVPMDPETKSPYGYTKKSATSFDICATFGESSQDLEGRGEFGRGGGISFDMGIAYPSYPYPYPGPEGDQWDHEAGLTCFTRTIDPDRYRVNPPEKL